MGAKRQVSPLLLEHIFISFPTLIFSLEVLYMTQIIWKTAWGRKKGRLEGVAELWRNPCALRLFSLNQKLSVANATKGKFKKSVFLCLKV